jgi:starch synthase
VVHRTGGLADSVHQYDASNDGGTGFLFDEPSVDALAATLREALAAHSDVEAWRRLQRRGMAEDFSWKRSAGEYVRLYERAVELATSRTR